MPDERENIRPPEKSLTPGQKPDTKPVQPAMQQKEVPIGAGVITPEMERYRAMIAKDPGSRVFAALAELYRKAGMLDEAVKLCLDGTKAHPKYMSGRVALARAYFDKGMVKEAKEEVLTVVSITPDNILANKILGEIQLLEGDTDRAVESFAKVLTLAPDDTEAKLRLDEARKSPGRKEPPRQEPEDILEADVIEEIAEVEPSEVIEDVVPIGREQVDTAAGVEPASREELPVDTPERFEDSGDLDIPLDDDSSLDDLLIDETSEDIHPGEGNEEPATDVEERKGREEGELWEVEEEPSSTTVGYVPDEGSELEPGREDLDTEIDLEGDQELVDEFGILEEDEGELTIEGLDNNRHAAVSAPGGRPRTGSDEKPRGEGITKPPPAVEPAMEPKKDTLDSQGVTITTETIADIYVKQGYFDKALSVYEELLGIYPTRDSLKQKIAFVRNKIRESSGDHQKQQMAPIEEEEAVAPDVPEVGSDRNLQENIENLNRWLLSIRRLRRQ